MTYPSFIEPKATVEGFWVCDVCLPNEAESDRIVRGMLMYKEGEFATFEVDVEEDEITFEFKDTTYLDKSLPKVNKKYIPEEYKKVPMEDMWGEYMQPHEYICYKVIKPLIIKILENCRRSGAIVDYNVSNTLHARIQAEIEERVEYITETEQELAEFLEEQKEFPTENASRTISSFKKSIESYKDELIELIEEEVNAYYLHFSYLLYMLKEMSETYEKCRRIYPKDSFMFIAIRSKEGMFAIEGYELEEGNVIARPTTLKTYGELEANLSNMLKATEAKYGKTAGYFAYNSDYPFTLDKETFIELLKN